MPIKSLTGTVLGTFGTYLRDRRTPTAEENERRRAPGHRNSTSASQSLA